MATAEAVRNRRLNRQAASSLRKQAPPSPPRPVVRTSAAVRTGLSDRERALLREATEPLFTSARIDLRYMGVAFLELHHLGWTAPFLAADPAVKHWPADLREQWADRQFELVWTWWTRLSVAARREVLSISRFHKKTASGGVAP